MTIKIYPSRLVGEPLEIHPHRDMTIHQWMLEKVADYRSDMAQRVAFEVDGKSVPPDDWQRTQIYREDDVAVYPVPGELATIAIVSAVVLAVASAAYSIYMMSTLDNSTSSQETGTALSMNAAKANTASLGDPIREIFGKYRVYPDYVMPPVSRFDADSPENFITTMFLCVGVGTFNIPQSGIRIGSTPLASFGSDVSYAIYQPGATVSGDARSENWWSSTEVGGTSSGSGLDLQSTAPDSVYVTADAVLFSGNTITLIGSSSSDDDDTTTVVPSSWVEGTIINVVAPDTYTISASGGYSVIYGDFSELFPGSIGMELTVTYNDNAYDLFVASYVPAVDPVPGVGGSAATLLASAAPATYDFSASGYTFNITWNGVIYTVNLVANYVTMSGLIEAITDALTGSGLVAQDDSGRVLITEKSSPYTGNTIINSALPAAVFGDSPVNTAGTASSGGSAGVEAHVTLAYNSATGTPFSGIPAGTARLSIMYWKGSFRSRQLMTPPLR